MPCQWICQNAQLIQHVSGLSIRLSEGSWAAPNAIEPTCPEHLSAADTARFIREGLTWARWHMQESEVMCDSAHSVA